MEEYLIKNELQKDYEDDERIWTVYVHIVPKEVRSSPDRDDYYDKYYVGITSRSLKARWVNGHGYEGQIFYNAIQKYGWDNILHEVIAEHLTLEEASEMEKALIKELDSCILSKNNHGYNATTGGYNNGSIPIPIDCYDSNGNYIKSYNSMNEAFKETGISTDNIYNCCRNGSSFRGYIFKFTKNAQRKDKELLRHNQNPLLKIDNKTGKILEKYISAEVVIDKYKFNRGIFYQVLNRYKKHEHDGYIWLYEKDYEKNGGDKYVQDIISIPYKECNGNWGKPVYMFDKDTKELLNKFDSLKDAHNKTQFPTSSISSVLTGHHKSYRNKYVFSYCDNYKDAISIEYNPKKRKVDNYE